jgi:hypothetical protein
LIGAVVFVVVGWIFLTIAIALRPALAEGIIQSAQQIFLVVFGNLISMAVAIILHEMVHGIFFWIYTRTPPIFGFRLTYAYAAAPGWYLPRGQFGLVALAPLVFLTLLGYILLAFAPPVLALPLLFGMTTNAAGAIGDIAVVIWLMRRGNRLLIEDLGSEVKVYSG